MIVLNSPQFDTLHVDYKKYITEVGTVADVTFYVTLYSRGETTPQLKEKERKLTSRDIEPKTTKAMKMNGYRLF